jgi:hypothetical protein
MMMLGGGDVGSVEDRSLLSEGAGEGGRGCRGRMPPVGRKFGPKPIRLEYLGRFPISGSCIEDGK